MEHILKCSSCKKYMLSPECSCGGKAVVAIPPKYSPDDKYADYRRTAKRQVLESHGLL